MTREELFAEARKLRRVIRQHRDSSRHELCWHRPDLWHRIEVIGPLKLLGTEAYDYFRGL